MLRSQDKALLLSLNTEGGQVQVLARFLSIALLLRIETHAVSITWWQSGRRVTI